MKDVQLKSVAKEKDLGVIISRDLKLSYQCDEVVKIANELVQDYVTCHYEELLKELNNFL